MERGVDANMLILWQTSDDNGCQTIVFMTAEIAVIGFSSTVSVLALQKCADRAPRQGVGR